MVSITDSWISPNYKYSDWIGADTDKKIEIFQDRINGWQLDIAEQYIENPHSGFAILSIVLSYFEMIGAFNRGDTKHTGSDEFKDGVCSVFSEFDINRNGSELGKLYKLCRCGMYHIAMTRVGILLDGHYDKPLHFENNNWKINPRILLERLKEHFNNEYVNEIKSDPNKARNFVNTISQVIPNISSLQINNSTTNNRALPSGVILRQI